MHTAVDTLNRRFGIDGQLRFALAADGFPVVEVTNAQATATVALQGAQVMRWQPHGAEPVIWLSPVAKLAPGKSIRGGVPVCWPWFGPHPGDAAKPAHGYARTVAWEPVEAVALADGATRLVFALRESEATRTHWPHHTPAELLLTIGRELTVELLTRNEEAAPVVIGEALHTYFQVSDIGAIAVQGLDGCRYADKVRGFAHDTQQGAIRFSGEVDRVYVSGAADCVIEDPGYRRAIRIAARGSRSTVVWNPWVEKAEKMGDLGEDGYRHMVCVESGNALDDVVEVPAGGEHRLLVTYSVEAR
jgi:glucose-6-phosphate 1-epimerase